jgi:hypothetical protein
MVDIYEGQAIKGISCVEKQFGYWSGKSAETALHSAVTSENAAEQKISLRSTSGITLAVRTYEVEAM